MATHKKEALVFGASGIIGWAVVNQILSGYPELQPFSKVTAVVNRKFPEPEFCWPKSDKTQLQLVSGVDLFASSAEGLAQSLRDEVKDLENLTHVFYFVFKPVDDDVKEAQTNCEMMSKVAQAMNEVAPNLETFVYSGGTRGYGIYDPNGIFKAPLEESMADNLPEDYKKTVAYPFYRDALTIASRDRKWTWVEVCPDAVIGFTPHGSAFSLALHWAQYLSLLAYIRDNASKSPASEQPEKLPFPGTMATWNAKFTPVSSRILGRASIYAALNPTKCGGKVLNVADSETPICFGDIWPGIAAWFGFEGVKPVENNQDQVKPGDFVAKHRHFFGDATRPKALRAGVGIGASQLDGVGWWLNFDRQLSLQRLRSVGFEEEMDPREGWYEAFRGFKEAGLII